MVKVLLIDKVENKKLTSMKNFSLENIYKKCNFRNDLNFKKRWTWKIKDNVYISLFSKDKGRSNNINKFDLPPPIDKPLYYGSMVVVKHNEQMLTNENAVSITLEEWETFYEKLFGGFEDLNDEDSYSDEEEIPEHLKTKEGYSKEDGFIVSDDDEDEDYNPDDEDDDLEELSDYDSNENIDDTGEDEEEYNESCKTGEDDEEEDDEEDDDYDDEEEEEEEDEDDEDDDIVGSELSEEEYIHE